MRYFNVPVDKHILPNILDMYLNYWHVAYISNTTWLDLYSLKFPRVISTCTIPFGIHRADYDQATMRTRLVFHLKYEYNMATIPRLSISGFFVAMPIFFCCWSVLRIDSGALSAYELNALLEVKQHIRAGIIWLRNESTQGINLILFCFLFVTIVMPVFQTQIIANTYGCPYLGIACVLVWRIWNRWHVAFEA